MRVRDVSFRVGPRSILVAALVAVLTVWVAACSSKSAGNGPGNVPDSAGGGPDGSTNGGDGGSSILDGPVDTAFLYADAPPPTVAPDALPQQGTFLGAFVDILNPEAGAATDQASEQRYQAAEVLIDRRWVIDNRFYDDSTEIVSDRTLWDVQNQLVPMITWMPYGNGNPLVEYIQGAHDALVHSEAQKLKALGVPVLMRWGHEMNGNWYPWSAYLNGEGGVNDGGLDDAGVPSSGGGKYIAAWKHVHDIFVQEGATNVYWVWCTNANDVPEVPWNHWDEYYPGDDYVDWIGIDAYNWGTSSSCCIWQSFATIMTPSCYEEYKSRKPIMLPETASAEVGGNKAQWIDDMHSDLKTEFSGIRAVVWFDINKETDWRVNSSATALTAYDSMAHDPFFNP